MKGRTGCSKARSRDARYRITGGQPRMMYLNRAAHWIGFNGAHIIGGFGLQHVFPLQKSGKSHYVIHTTTQARIPLTIDDSRFSVMKIVPKRVCQQIISLEIYIRIIITKIENKLATASFFKIDFSMKSWLRPAPWMVGREKVTQSQIKLLKLSSMSCFLFRLRWSRTGFSWILFVTDHWGSNAPSHIIIEFQFLLLKLPTAGSSNTDSVHSFLHLMVINSDPFIAAIQLLKNYNPLKSNYHSSHHLHASMRNVILHYQ